MYSNFCMWTTVQGRWWRWLTVLRSGSDLHWAFPRDPVDGCYILKQLFDRLLSHLLKTHVSIFPFSQTQDLPVFASKCQGLLYQFMERRRALSQLWRTGTYSRLGLPAPSLDAPRGKNTLSELCSFFSSSLVLQKPAGTVEDRGRLK